MIIDDQNRKTNCFQQVHRNKFRASILSCIIHRVKATVELNFSLIKWTFKFSCYKTLTFTFDLWHSNSLTWVQSITSVNSEDRKHESSRLCQPDMRCFCTPHRLLCYNIVRFVYLVCHSPLLCTARCTLVQSAVLRAHVVCLSVCLWRWWIVIT